MLSGVTAREKMSVGCAWSRVCVVRYCFDIVVPVLAFGDVSRGSGDGTGIGG